MTVLCSVFAVCCAEVGNRCMVCVDWCLLNVFSFRFSCCCLVCVLVVVLWLLKYTAFVVVMCVVVVWCVSFGVVCRAWFVD